MGAPVRGKLRALKTYWPACDESRRLISAWKLSGSPGSLVSRLRFGRPLPRRSSWDFRPAVPRGSASTASGTPAGVLGISCLTLTCDTDLERPRLLDDGVLSSRLFRPDSVNLSVLVAFLSSTGRVLRRCAGSENSGDGALSLIGLTSSGRGRSGDPGDCGMLKGGGLFQGVAEPDVSIDSRCWWKLRESENEAARGVSKPQRGPVRGV